MSEPLEGYVNWKTDQSVGTNLVRSWDGWFGDFREAHMEEMAHAIDAAIATEREACARIAESLGIGGEGQTAARLIRERRQS